MLPYSQRSLAFRTTRCAFLPRLSFRSERKRFATTQWCSEQPGGRCVKATRSGSSSGSGMANTHARNGTRSKASCRPGRASGKSCGSSSTHIYIAYLLLRSNCGIYFIPRIAHVELSGQHGTRTFIAGTTHTSLPGRLGISASRLTANFVGKTSRSLSLQPFCSIVCGSQPVEDYGRLRPLPTARPSQRLASP